ncbi:hypothetical protein SE_p611 (plasmid) [Staphylococcus epidermidis ATCC 12228]|uniref:Uncharacterized protein n=1 Tax=Staphylococcus epidermidis (strain ATCC 12228 / FDA PCI 1200) TaxID=176280 RepID=A0A0H2VL85_STAES|nr:hypothetical protein SE_p611 [Staphylococcus epidermidis ATCC 12228]KAB2250059.1 hypothetical protein F9B65_11975 [Staphylococcus epidermidis]
MFFIYYNKSISKKKPPAGTLGVFTYNDISAICYFQYILSYAFCKIRYILSFKNIILK